MSTLQKDLQTSESQISRLILCALYLAGGLLIFLFGSNYFRLFPTNKNMYYEWGLTLFLLVLAIFLRKNRRFQKYWKIAYALFIASFANSLLGYLGNWLAPLFPTPVSTAQDLAIDKLSQAFPIVLSILLLTILSGDDLGSIFLKRGNLRQSLLFGVLSFGVFAAIFAAIAVTQSNAPLSRGITASGLRLNYIITALPWILVFVFANSLMEELWFRGVSLQKLNPFLGVMASAFVNALVFGIPHLGATYITPIQMFIFPVIVATLGFVNGVVMLKTEAIWGSVLFHAGYDLLVIIPVLVSG